MTTPERLAKVAEDRVRWHVDALTQALHQRWHVGCNRECGGRLDDYLFAARLLRDPDGVLAQIETQAEARGAARVREAVEALASKREQQFLDFTRAAESAAHVGDDSAANWAANIAAIYRADANDLRAALDAAEKAAVGGVSVPTSEREGGNGPGHAGQVFGPSDRRTAAQEGDDYERGRHDAALAAAVALQGFAVKSFARLPNNPRGAALWDAASYLHPDDRNGLRVRRWESEYGADARSGQ